MNWEAHLRQIEQPDHPALQELLETARENTRKQLVKDGAEVLDDETIRYRGRELDTEALNKFSYTFYFDWERDESPSFMFLVQNPGPLVSRRHLDDEADELLDTASYLEQVRVNRGYLKNWLWRQNSRFSEGFFPLLAEHGLIQYDSLEEYLNGAFYSDFILTDVVKYRVSTSEIGGGRGGNAEVSYDTLLSSELEAIEPDLIFAFGSRCWQVLYRNLDLEPIQDDAELTTSVTNAHGYSFQYDGGCVIPLTHFSGQNSFLRNSYHDYLDDGLRAFQDSC